MCAAQGAQAPPGARWGGAQVQTGALGMTVVLGPFERTPQPRLFVAHDGPASFPVPPQKVASQP